MAAVNGFFLPLPPGAARQREVSQVPEPSPPDRQDLLPQRGTVPLADPTHGPVLGLAVVGLRKSHTTFEGDRV